MATILTSANDWVTLRQGYFGSINNGATRSMNGLTLDGTGGADTLSVDYRSSLFTQTTNAAGVTTLSTASGNSLHLVNFERIIFTDGTRTLAAPVPPIIGTAGDDILIGTARGETISGGAGNDTLVGGAGNDRLDGGAGNDSLDGGTGADKLIGGAGDDTYIIDSAADRIVEKAAQGTDTVNTALAKFSLATVDAATSLPLFAQVENLVYTGSAAFTGTGNGAANAITGGVAADKLAGAAGNDTLTGNAGNDAENGGAGNDTLHGDDGADTLVGGAGSDNFVFDTTPASGNADLIKDFALGDKIQLDDAVFTTLSVGALTDAAFCLGTAAAAADDRIIYDKASGSLYYDADGSGAGAATLIATVGTSLHAALTAASFEVI